MQQPLTLLTKNATIFGNMKYLQIVVIATRQFIYFLYIFFKKVKKMEKILVLILVLLTIFFCHPYLITMFNVSSNLV